MVDFLRSNERFTVIRLNFHYLNYVGLVSRRLNYQSQEQIFNGRWSGSLSALLVHKNCY